MRRRRCQCRRSIHDRRSKFCRLCRTTIEAIKPIEAAEARLASTNKKRRKVAEKVEAYLASLAEEDAKFSAKEVPVVKPERSPFGCALGRVA